jgi:uncharacterized protein YjbJ (UPF0337 family)
MDKDRISGAAENAMGSAKDATRDAADKGKA